MNLYPLELPANIIQCIIIIALPIWRAVRYRNENSLAHRLFMWGLMAHALLNIYWTVSLILENGENPLTFKASDTATIALFLLWVSMFQCKCGVRLKSKRAWQPIPVCAFVFSIWNVIWWNLWSPNLIINALWAIAMSMLTYLIFYSLSDGGAFTKRVTVLAGLFLFIVVVLETPMYFTNPTGTIFIACNWICAAAWAALIILFFVRAMKDRAHRTAWLFASMLLSMYAEFLSEDIRYSIFLLCENIVLAVLIICFREDELGEADTV